MIQQRIIQYNVNNDLSLHKAERLDQSLVNKIAVIAGTRSRLGASLAKKYALNVEQVVIQNR